MPADPSRGDLIRVTAMGLMDSLAPLQTTQQRKSCIDNEYASQNQPTPQQHRCLPSGMQRKCAENQPKKATTHIAHENSRTWKVPEQETQRRRSNQPLDRGITRHAGKRITQRCEQAEGERLGTSDAIDPIHEVEQIEPPDQAHTRQCKPHRPKVKRMAE